MNGISDLFDIRKELRQGDGLSILLFNLVLEGVIRRATNKNNKNNNKFLNADLLAYADDIDIIGRSARDVGEQSKKKQRKWALG